MIKNKEKHTLRRSLRGTWFSKLQVDCTCFSPSDFHNLIFMLFKHQTPLTALLSCGSYFPGNRLASPLNSYCEQQLCSKRTYYLQSTKIFVFLENFLSLEKNHVKCGGYSQLSCRFFVAKSFTYGCPRLVLLRKTPGRKNFSWLPFRFLSTNDDILSVTFC